MIRSLVCRRGTMSFPSSSRYLGTRAGEQPGSHWCLVPWSVTVNESTIRAVSWPRRLSCRPQDYQFLLVGMVTDIVMKL